MEKKKRKVLQTTTKKKNENPVGCGGVGAVVTSFTRPRATPACNAMPCRAP